MNSMIRKASCLNLLKPTAISLSKTQVTFKRLEVQKRLFSDDSGFHDDFKTIRKKYENKDKQATPYEEIEKYIKKVIIYAYIP